MPGTDTYLGLRAFVDELVRCGMRDACTSPGSRSTPLALSLAREPRLRCTSHIDERCAGFFALGLAKATGVPAALACTSGTAAANYAPAVIEAHEARVPLLVLTADRPPELRELGAGQTVDQVKLYGSAAKWYFEIDDHPASPARVRWLRQLACRAFWTALDGRAGPVHLNFALREPLVPDGPPPPAPDPRRTVVERGTGRGEASPAPDPQLGTSAPGGTPPARDHLAALGLGGAAPAPDPQFGAGGHGGAPGPPHPELGTAGLGGAPAPQDPQLAAAWHALGRGAPPDPRLPGEESFPGRAGGRPWVTRPRTRLEAGTAVLEGLEAVLLAHPRALVVAGRAERDPGLGEALAAFAERAALPLLAEPLSGARRGTAAVAHYDALLRDPSWAAAQAPDLVLRVGDLPTSKPLRVWLAGLDEALQISFDAESAWQDPAAVVGTIVAADPRATLDALAERLPRKRKDTSWLDGWKRADRAAAGAIAAVVGPAGLNEPRVAAELGAGLPPEATLVIASSMPIRDAETFFPVRPHPPRTLSNRGANGIDGTVSTAFGVAAASAGPTVLLIGDVALAHDVGGLLAASRLSLKLVIVLIDNDGGGIFHFLPVAGEGQEFETHVATPHGLDFAHAAALYGCGWERAQDPVTFRAALARALAADRTTIICVRTNREENVDLHRRVWESVRAAT